MRKIFEKGSKSGERDIIVERFDNITEFLKVINSRTNRLQNSSHTEDTDKDPWHGTNTWEEANEILTYGWDSVLDRIRSDIERNSRIDKTVNITRPNRKRSMAGGRVDINRHLKGLPKQMVQTKRVVLPSRTVSITYDVCASGSVTPEDLTKAGIVLLTAVNILEKMGYRVHLSMGGGFFSGKEMVAGFLTLKDYKDHLDLKKLAFPIANAAMLRRFCFSHLEGQPDYKDKSGFDYGYGYPCYLLDKYASKQEEARFKGVVAPRDVDVLLDYKKIEECEFDAQQVIGAYLTKASAVNAA